MSPLYQHLLCLDNLLQLDQVGDLLGQHGLLALWSLILPSLLQAFSNFWQSQQFLCVWLLVGISTVTRPTVLELNVIHWILQCSLPDVLQLNKVWDFCLLYCTLFPPKDRTISYAVFFLTSSLSKFHEYFPRSWICSSDRLSTTFLRIKLKEGNQRLCSLNDNTEVMIQKYSLPDVLQLNSVFSFIKEFSPIILVHPFLDCLYFCTLSSALSLMAQSLATKLAC